MFPNVSISTSLRFSEVRLFLNDIAQREVPPPATDSDVVAVLRGLFFVHLYGAFEHAISQSTQALLQAINDVGVQYEHLDQMFYTVALDHKFRSIVDRSNTKKWAGRRELLSEQRCADACKLNDTLFSSELENVWFKTLGELFANLGITEPVVPDARYHGYIDEVVDKRNAVAHGRESPLTVGSMRTPDLEIRFKAVSNTATYFIGCMDRHLQTRGFVAQAHRGRY